MLAPSPPAESPVLDHLKRKDLEVDHLIEECHVHCHHRKDLIPPHIHLIESLQQEERNIPNRHQGKGLAQGLQVEKGHVQGLRAEKGHVQGLQVEEGHVQGLQVEKGHVQGLLVEEGHAQGLQLEEGHVQGLRVEEGHVQGLRVEEGHVQGLRVEEGHAQGLRVEEGHAQGLRVEDDIHARGLRVEEDPVLIPQLRNEDDQSLQAQGREELIPTLLEGLVPDLLLQITPRTEKMTTSENVVFTSFSPDLVYSCTNIYTDYLLNMHI